MFVSIVDAAVRIAVRFDETRSEYTRQLRLQERVEGDPDTFGRFPSLSM